MLNNFEKPKVKAPNSQEYHKISKMVKENNLHTVCQEAACPNIGECWEKKHATFMILGSICTRGCKFCNVATGKPMKVDPFEPEKVAQSVKTLGLRHAVITSVDRDDLEDGGADQFVKVIQAIRHASPQTTIEILTPDFLKKNDDITVKRLTVDFPPDVYNHNIETVPSLYPSIRPGARYFNSLNLLKTAKNLNPKIFTKSGLMVGLGEEKEEILQLMDDLRAADVDFITIGQYLQPTSKHAEVKKYYTAEEFRYLERMAWIKGFLMVSASPLTRSSYHADRDFDKLREARAKSM